MNQSINTQDSFKVFFNLPDYCREHNLTTREIRLYVMAIAWFAKWEGSLPDSYFMADQWIVTLEATEDEFEELYRKGVFDIWNLESRTFMPSGFGKVWA